MKKEKFTNIKLVFNVAVASSRVLLSFKTLLYFFIANISIMDILDCIRTRRSVRKFQPVRIDEKILDAILDAANCAPCAGNLQTARFLVVEDEKKKKIIAKAALDQEWIATAPVVVLVLTDPKIVKEEYGVVGEKYDSINAALAAENLILAAWGFGIGSTFVGSFTESRLRREFKIPDSIRIHAIIPLGYPAEIPQPVAKIGAENFTYREEYGEMLKPKHKLISGFVYPEKEELRIGELAEAAGKKFAQKIKETGKKIATAKKTKQ